MVPTPFISHKSSVSPSQELSVRYAVDITLRVCVLAIGKRFVEDLIFPHVQVQDHDNEDDTVVEPFACDVNVQRFTSTATGNVNIERV